MVCGFEVAYVDRDGDEHHVAMADAAGVRIEDGWPVRSFPT